MKIYAVYKGNNYLMQGTVKELADYFKVKEKTVYWWSSPTQIKRNKGNFKVAIKLDKEKDEDEN